MISIQQKPNNEEEGQQRAKTQLKYFYSIVIMNYRKVTDNFEKMPCKVLEKTWVDEYIGNYLKQIPVSPVILEGRSLNSRAMLHHSEESRASSKEKSSRIKFKSHDPGKFGLESGDPSNVTYKKLNFTNESSQNLTRSVSEEDEDPMDDTTCYHRDCSFAYNITADSRNTALLVECLPQSIYQKLAEMWNLDRNALPKVVGNTCRFTETQKEEENKMVDEYIKNVEKDMAIRSEISEDLQVDVGSQHNFDEEGEKANHRREIRKRNPYLKFLKKNSMSDSNQKKAPNLGKKAGKITKMIIGNFMKWYESLGGGDDEQSFIDEPTLHELFQVGFDMPAAKPMAIRIKEMPTVPECLATLRNEPKHATTYALRQYLKQDMKLENIPMKMFAFGRMLPKEKNLRYKPPRNYVRQTWMECSRVPKDLNTMKTVWVGLERLRSTIAFSNWLKNHPEISPPAYLSEKGLLNINYEEWNQMYKGFEFDVTVDVVGSDQKISREKSFSKGSSSMSYSGSMKFDASSESFM